MKQHEAVIAVMRANHGYATLGYLYQNVLKIPGCTWGTKTPFASIRRIVQTHPAFFRIRPGLWALTAERDQVLAELQLSENVPPSRTDEFSHSYFQGLVTEVGNIEGYATYVPKQDKNKLFLGKRLQDVSSLHDYYGFTYEHILRRARTIDVTWFNSRQFPFAFFEVEHSTDIQNSLLKFVEFQDFRIRFYIVADKARYREYQSKLAGSAFSPIRSVVSFWDYDKLSDYHARQSALAAAGMSLGER